MSAPMATISTPAFRVLLEEFGGCDLYGSEMINAASLLTGGPFESYYVMSDPVPEKLVHQLVGGDAETLGKAAEYLDGLPGFGIDINMGCSAPEIVRAGGGIRWMRSIDAARSLVGSLRARIRNKRLSVKLRLGEREDPAYLLSFCQALVAEGIDFLTLHPRTRKDKFSRFARWEYVRLLKEHLPIPVIGNGDVRTYEDYRRVREMYQPDGVMIGREAVRSPWIFAYIRHRESSQSPSGQKGTNLYSASKGLGTGSDFNSIDPCPQSRGNGFLGPDGLSSPSSTTTRSFLRQGQRWDGVVPDSPASTASSSFFRQSIQNDEVVLGSPAAATNSSFFRQSIQRDAGWSGSPASTGNNAPRFSLVESWDPFTVNLYKVAHRFLDLLPRYQPKEFLESRAKRFLKYFSEHLVFGHWFFTEVWKASGWEELRPLVDRYFAQHPEEAVRVLE